MIRWLFFCYFFYTGPQCVVAFVVVVVVVVLAAPTISLHSPLTFPFPFDEFKSMIVQSFDFRKHDQTNLNN